MSAVSTTAHPGKNLARSRRYGVVTVLIATFALTSSGCTIFDSIGNSFKYNSVWNEAATKMRYRSLSSKSWHNRKHQYCNEGCLDDFCAGYRQGYEDVAGGGTGCTPNFPPRDYWGWQHQTAEGQKKVSAWFSGYPNGARAAEEDGIGNWSQIQMSSNLQSQYMRAGVLPKRDHAVYPITEVTPGQGGPAAAPASPMPVSPVPVSTQPLPHGSPVPMTNNAYPINQGPVPMSNSIVTGVMSPNG